METQALEGRRRMNDFIESLRAIVGQSFVLTGDAETRRYRTGFRCGHGNVLAVVRPGTLVELWRIAQACVAANKIIIMQAANTGLTGGSTPNGEGYDRDIVIISTLRLDAIFPIRDGQQVICLPGAALDSLEKMLKPLGREPHSVIGSSCIGASVGGGIANNSGGALVRRGPAYTQLALFARLHDDGKLELVNHLGITLKGDPEEILKRLDSGDFTEADIQDGGQASDSEYAQHVRQVDAATPARFNADPRRLFEASGCAGKLVVFAVRLDTFPAESIKTLFYIGTNDTKVLADIRRHILKDFKTLPISGEYMHAKAFDISEKYGKDTFLVIRWLGTKYLAPMFALKSRVDALFDRAGIFPKRLSDRILQFFSQLFPHHLPLRARQFRARFEHHLLLEIAGPGLDEARKFLEGFFADKTRGAYFECDAEEARRAMLNRFAAAGAAVRYRVIHSKEVEDILALDIALRRNDMDWFEKLPPDIEQAIAAKVYYGHFLCHVFHQDYLIKKGQDVEAIKKKMLDILDTRGAQYPAEHNVGHLYVAKPHVKGFYQTLDPCNVFNPGVGMTSKKTHWKE
jgi:D-lactate dehydrogenase (quinone)